MENPYDNLLEYYDELFPVEPARVSFIEALARKTVAGRTDAGSRVKILDVGCATGTFALALMRLGMDVTGIDLNSAMIQSACRRNPEPRTNARFFCMDMLEIGSTFAAGRFDLCLCLGNTLVHLDGPKSISRFLKQARQVVRPGGAFVFQVVNYERVAAEGLTRLPTIESPRARFEREYRKRDDGRISFEATIFSSNEQPVFRDRVALYPASPVELVELLHQAGFEKVDLYDDFSGDTMRGNSLGVVGVAVR
jgi:SAM-dependent methyltransferase